MNFNRQRKELAISVVALWAEFEWNFSKFFIKRIEFLRKIQYMHRLQLLHNSMYDQHCFSFVGMRPVKLHNRWTQSSQIVWWSPEHRMIIIIIQNLFIDADRMINRCRRRTSERAIHENWIGQCCLFVCNAKCTYTQSVPIFIYSLNGLIKQWCCCCCRCWRKWRWHTAQNIYRHSNTHTHTNK